MSPKSNHKLPSWGGWRPGRREGLREYRRRRGEDHVATPLPGTDTRHLGGVAGAPGLPPPVGVWQGSRGLLFKLQAVAPLLPHPCPMPLHCFKVACNNVPAARPFLRGAAADDPISGSGQLQPTVAGRQPAVLPLDGHHLPQRHHPLVSLHRHVCRSW